MSKGKDRRGSFRAVTVAVQAVAPVGTTATTVTTTATNTRSETN